MTDRIYHHATNGRSSSHPPQNIRVRVANMQQITKLKLVADRWKAAESGDTREDTNFAPRRRAINHTQRRGDEERASTICNQWAILIEEGMAMSMIVLSVVNHQTCTHIRCNKQHKSSKNLTTPREDRSKSAELSGDLRGWSNFSPAVGHRQYYNSEGGGDAQ